MTNDSLQSSRISSGPFDQDAFVNVTDADHAGMCPECRVGRCGRCADADCSCPHPFAAIGRAVVELDGSISRARQLLGQVRGTLEKTDGSMGGKGHVVSARRARVMGRHDDPSGSPAD